ncbi:MAG: chemotaxis protein CheR [Spirochaetaceae bacterium]|nr:MAG: chemotaxis protein CheR [Spirochaetaceae bacterium]
MSNTSEAVDRTQGGEQIREAKQRLGGLHQHQLQEQDDIETVDYKMVTFSLGGKDYGIDILKIKEIAKFAAFTYVPNAPPFVSGVYNLRGDIISIIDLRVMFNLPAQRKAEGSPEDGLILRLDELMIGVVVDSIDKVVGIVSSRIQPPHPIFGDVNIKYISGVVEKDGRLYIILDVDRIFAKDESAPDEPEPLTAAVASKDSGLSPYQESPEVPTSQGAAGKNEEELDLDFIREGLVTFKGFYPDEVSSTWLHRRYPEWRAERKQLGTEVQLTGEEDAEEFLRTFYSPYSGRFWGEDYVEGVKALLPEEMPKNISVWNPGCGKGYETYSLATVLRMRYPDHILKIWAGDKDLLNISTAPNLVFGADIIPTLYEPYLVEAKNGFAFSSQIKDAILFEYHDVANTNAVPNVDIIMARDLISFLPPKQQALVLNEFSDKTSSGALLILGQNEYVSETLGWQHVGSAIVNAYRKL